MFEWSNSKGERTDYLLLRHFQQLSITYVGDLGLLGTTSGGRHMDRLEGIERLSVARWGVDICN